MNEKVLHPNTGSSKGMSSGTANTVIGSAGAIVGALGVTVIAAAAPVAGAIVTAGGALVAAGALYRKLSEEHRRAEGVR
jgi:hypothetical protein